jgi:hypothetical protein
MDPISEDVQPIPAFVSTKYIRETFRDVDFLHYVIKAGMIPTKCIVIVWNDPILRQYDVEVVDESVPAVYQVFHSQFPRVGDNVLRIAFGLHARSGRDYYLKWVAGWRDLQ